MIALLPSMIALRVAQAHGDIVRRALEMPANRPEWCSYAGNLAAYTAERILMTRFARRVNGYTIFRHAEIMAEYYKAMLYVKPCGRCRACLSRRKPWPKVKLTG